MTADSVRIEHSSLGVIEVEAGDILCFPGLPGFPEARSFVVREHDRESIFGWLVCLDVRDLAFPVTDPQVFVPDYAPAFSSCHLQEVDHREGDALQVLAIARISDGAVDLNLAAPLLIDLRTRRGVQAVLEGDVYSVRTRVVDPAAPRSSRDPRGRGAREAPRSGRGAPPE